jgi:hypothetical protein
LGGKRGGDGALNTAGATGAPGDVNITTGADGTADDTPTMYELK